MKKIELVQLTKEQLCNTINECVKLQLENFKQSLNFNTQNEYLTRKETAKLLRVNLSTLHNYTSQGIIQANQIGGKILFCRAEVENAIVKLNKYQ